MSLTKPQASLKDADRENTADTMVSLSVSTHRGLVHWQWLLVAVFLFNFWCQPTTAELTVVSTYAAEGKDVLLRVHNKPPNVAHILWYKGAGTENENIIGFLSKKLGNNLRSTSSERLVLNEDGSMLIKKASKSDSGIYTISVHLTDSTSEEAFGMLTVYETELEVSLVASKTTVTENKDTVVFTCNTNALYIHWFFQGIDLNLNKRMKLSKDHRTLTINPVKREDAGTYWCEVSNPVEFTESWPIMLRVNFE